MKNLLLIIFILSTKLTLGQGISADYLLEYPLKSIISYCQKDTSKIISKQVLTYNNAHKIEQSSLYKNDREVSRTIYGYNNEGLQITKSLYNLTPELKLIRVRVFEYNVKDKLIYEGFNDTKGNNTKNTYQYNSNGLLISSSTECNYTKWKFTYEYDSNNLLVKKFKNSELEITYEYDNDLLVVQTNFNRSRDNILKFEYGENGKLLLKKENNKIIEQNKYLNNYLDKKWTYYFGIDPCYDKCCNQYFIKYEYYK